MDSQTGTLVLTYAELAARLSIKPASAKRLAQRRKWHRVVGNDGVARVHVPLSAIPDDILGDVIAPVPDDMSPPVAPDLSHRVAHLEGTIEGLMGQLEAEQRRADAAEARARDIALDRDAWRQAAQRSIWSRLFGGPSGR